MRRCFAVALSGALLVGLYCYIVSGQSSGASFVSSNSLAHDAQGFGGLSGVEITATGEQLFAVSDRGTLFMASLSRNSEQQIESIQWSQGAPLKDAEGKKLRPKNRDSEGLALIDDRHLAVSFEGAHRVELYQVDGSFLSEAGAADPFTTLQGNSGLEALAVTPKGQLLALPERSGAMTRPFPVYMLGASGWRQETEIPRRGAFLPVGADFGPDGALYLLERDYFLSGFRSRVRRFEWTGAGIGAEEELLVTRLWRHGNLEGISIWVDTSGKIRLTMIGDDNFIALQRGELVEYIAEPLDLPAQGS